MVERWNRCWVGWVLALAGQISHQILLVIRIDPKWIENFQIKTKIKTVTISFSFKNPVHALCGTETETILVLVHFSKAEGPTRNRILVHFSKTEGPTRMYVFHKKK